jgi:hypothetical protein
MKVGTATKRSKKVDVYKVDGTFVGTYSSFSSAARATGVKVQNVYKTCNGYKTSLNGYNFVVKEDK